MDTRRSSRAIILNQKNEIYLFQYHFDYFEEESSIWITPGGGLEADESFDEALEREVYEELGIHVTKDYKQIYYRYPTYSLKNHVKVECEERFYLVHLNEEEFSYQNWTDSEKQRMRKGKWWSMEQIQQSKDEFFSKDIISLLYQLTNGDIPDIPTEIV